MHGSTTNGSGPVDPSAFLGGPKHGRAALILVESLMHALVAKGTILREDFIEIVEGAAEVEHELVVANGSYPVHKSGSLLSPLAAAFKRELGW